jgi:hypothetical protein
MLANIARRHTLDTLAIGACSSACTLVFAAGGQRSAAPGTRLGFHRYRLDALNLHPFVDIEAEQRTDIEYFASRGVTQAFLARVFSRPSAEMWFPSLDELADANVLHHVIDAPFVTALDGPWRVVDLKRRP